MREEGVAGLIPEYWRDIDLQRPEDLVYLGRGTIHQMASSWRYRLAEIEGSLGTVQELIAVMAGMNAAAVRHAAEDYENPEFPEIGVAAGNWSGDPEPLDLASQRRAGGSTTFNVCGWCKHCGSGTCRYNYHITATCRLVTMAGLDDSERAFNTPCIFGSAPDAYFEEVRNGLSVELERHRERRAQVERKIKALQSLAVRAKEKPPLPGHRPHDWFNLGDPVVCYVGNWEERIVPGSFAAGEVIDGYRHHDGCVSVRFSEKVHDKEYLDGHGGGFGVSRPEVLLRWEFEYLVDNPQFAAQWLVKGGSGRLERHDPAQFLTALAEASWGREGQAGCPVNENVEGVA